MFSCRENSASDAFMERAVALAYRGRGGAAPNPCVGAVLVRDCQIVAEGWHAKYGGPHAERACLADAREKGVDPAGCTMYVTLEPCNHHGKTPPCVDALLEAKVAKVVIGVMDPNSKAAGGAARLREHGVEVVEGVCERQCLDLLADFIIWQQSHSTFNLVKMAATLDGKIASRHRRPEPVSCGEAFSEVHAMRSQVDAVIVGGGTFYADNPSLTCRMDRLPEGFRQPKAVIITSTLPDDPQAHELLNKGPERTIFWTTDEAARSANADRLRERGVSVWPLPGGKGRLNLSTGFERLRYDLGCHTTLCEGGGRLAMHMILQGLADEIIHFVTPRILGDEAAPSAYMGRVGVDMAEAVNLRLVRGECVGSDLKLTLKVR